MSWFKKRRMNNKKTTKTTMLIITLLTVVTIISMINNIQYLFNIIVGEDDDGNNNNNSNCNRGLLSTQPQILSSSSLQTTPNTNTNTNNKQQPTAAICMIIKSQLYDLDEWVDYHLALGFNTIYIYDNSDSFDLQLWIKSKHQKQDSLLYNKIQVFHHPGYNRQQLSAYTKCIQSNKRSTEEMDLLPPEQSMYMSPYIHDWLAFIDMDEFIVLKKNHYTTIQELLTKYKEYDGLALNRITYYFDPITQLTQQPTIPVTRKFNMRLKQPDIYVKTIAKASQIKEPNVHFPKYKRNNFIKHVDTNKQPCTYVNEEVKQNEDTTTTTFNKPERNPTRPEDIAVIHHYETKSLEEYQLKCLRGDVAYGKHPIACMPANKIIQHFQSLTYNNNNDGNNNGGSGLIFDDTAWQFLSKSLPEKYGIYN